LKADIAERCQLLNDKKAALDAKTDTSALSKVSTPREGVRRPQG
jgi:hypothetical protein